MGDDKFITGETHDELIYNYLKEKGISNETEMNQKDFFRMVRQKSNRMFNERFP